MRANGKPVNQKTPDIRIGNLRISEIRKSGGFTFRPVRGGKMVCNQLPELGRIGKKRAETLRRQLWPKQHIIARVHRDNYQVPVTRLSPPAQTRVTAKIFSDDYVVCPNCSHGAYFPGAYKLVDFYFKCSKCGHGFNAQPA